MLRVLVFTVSVLGCFPAFGQFELNNDVQDCPIEYLGQVGSMHQYRARSCGSPSVVVIALSPKKVTCPVACNGLVCADSIYGGGSDPKAKAKKKINKFGMGKPAFQTWAQLTKQGRDGKSACSPTLTLDGIRRLKGSKLVPAIQYKKEFDKLVESVPGWLDDFLKLEDRKAQDAAVRNFNAKLNSIFMVSIPAKEGYSNPYRFCDYPAQESLTAEVTVQGPKTDDNSGTYPRKVEDVKAEDVGVVKIVDGDQTFFFHLAMTDIKSSNGMHPVATLRTGVQVPATDAETKTAKFVGKNCWTHKVEFDGHVYLVTSKDKRVAATE